jgi:thioredoxin 1
MSDTAQPQGKSGAQHIQDADFETVVLKSSKPVLVDFYAEWCGPCKMAAPVLDELAREQETVAIVKMDVDENREAPSKFGVMSIPTVILFKDGKEVTRQVGFSGKQGYLQMIESL